MIWAMIAGAVIMLLGILIGYGLGARPKFNIDEDKD
jgi:hypothetical protein